MKQITPCCLQVGQPSEEQASEEQQAADEAVVTHKAAGPDTAHDSVPSSAGGAEVLRAERQAAKLQAEKGLAALQASLQKLESPRQLEEVALKRNLPLRAATLQASRLQLQQQVVLQRRRHQEARYAELCAQDRLALAEGAMDRHEARAGEQPHSTPVGHYSKQPPRCGAAARKAWQELPWGFPGHPYIAHRVQVLTQGSTKPARLNSSLPKTRFSPGSAAAVRLQHRGGLHAAVSPQVRIAATCATDHTGCCELLCRGRLLTVVAPCSCADKASQVHRACPGIWQSVWPWGPALMLPAAQPPACHDSSLAVCLGRATLRAVCLGMATLTAVLKTVGSCCRGPRQAHPREPPGLPQPCPPKTRPTSRHLLHLHTQGRPASARMR